MVIQPFSLPDEGVCLDLSPLEESVVVGLFSEEVVTSFVLPASDIELKEAPSFVVVSPEVETSDEDVSVVDVVLTDTDVIETEVFIPETGSLIFNCLISPKI